MSAKKEKYTAIAPPVAAFSRQTTQNVSCQTRKQTRHYGVGIIHYNVLDSISRRKSLLCRVVQPSWNTRLIATVQSVTIHQLVVHEQPNPPRHLFRSFCNWRIKQISRSSTSRNTHTHTHISVRFGKAHNFCWFRARNIWTKGTESARGMW